MQRLFIPPRSLLQIHLVEDIHAFFHYTLLILVYSNMLTRLLNIMASVDVCFLVGLVQMIDSD
jgi:hypothetical protein